jgi:hypothetical protein
MWIYADPFLGHTSPSQLVGFSHEKYSVADSGYLSRIPDPGYRIRIFRSRGQNDLGNMIRDLHPRSGFCFHPGSRSQKSIESRIPHPNPQHWKSNLLKRLKIGFLSFFSSVSLHLDPDLHPYGSGSSRAKSVRFHTDPDPPHWLQVLKKRHILSDRIHINNPPRISGQGRGIGGGVHWKKQQQ